MSNNPPASTAPPSIKQSPTTNTKPSRLPAPTLFVGPPSRNASQLSLTRPSLDKPREPLHRHKSQLSRTQTPATEADGTDAIPTIPALKKPSDKETEAKWREMRTALDEVSLTAHTSTRVFGKQHAAALDELRLAQIELARAWGRGNEEKAASASASGESSGALSGGPVDMDRKPDVDGRGRRDTVSSQSTALSDESGVSDSTARTGASTRLEEETAEDIRLAGERRAANEAYFVNVDKGVRDVVARLEVVAQAMRGVESESRSLWSMTDRSSTESRREGKDTQA